jgi:hypothetical protein
MKLHSLAAAAAATLALAVPATAGAEVQWSAASVGLEVKGVDLAKSQVYGVLHCVAPEFAGKMVALTAVPGVDLSGVKSGTTVGFALNPSRMITEVQATPPCQVQPTGGQPQPPQGGQPQPAGPLPQGGQPPKDGQPQPGGQFPQAQAPQGGKPGAGPQGDGPPRLLGAFTSRVWRFTGEADGFSDGKLSMTVGKILNLPKRFASQDDDLLDQDAIVLVGAGVRVFDANGRRTAATALDDADTVRVQGKVLPPAKWQKDEDGQRVTTIRAKRVYITG